MRRVLLTGMSGTGKSTLIGLLAALGHKSVDTDDGDWCVPPDGVQPAGPTVQPDWIWHAKRMEELLDSEDADVLFVAGCVENQGAFYDRFDEIVLLTAPQDLIAERLTNRTTNPYGRDPGELARVLDDRRTVEPLLRDRATLVIDTSAPLQEVFDTVLRLVHLD